MHPRGGHTFIFLWKQSPIIFQQFESDLPICVPVARASNGYLPFPKTWVCFPRWRRMASELVSRSPFYMDHLESRFGSDFKGFQGSNFSFAFQKPTFEVDLSLGMNLPPFEIKLRMRIQQLPCGVDISIGVKELHLRIELRIGIQRLRCGVELCIGCKVPPLRIELRVGIQNLPCGVDISIGLKELPFRVDFKNHLGSSCGLHFKNQPLRWIWVLEWKCPALESSSMLDSGRRPVEKSFLWNLKCSPSG